MERKFFDLPQGRNFWVSRTMFRIKGLLKNFGPI